MRIVNINKNSNQSRRKYFLSFEGVKTEVQYFQGIVNNKEFLNLRDDIEVILLLRNHSYLGWSNPLKVFNRTKFCIDNLSRNERNVSSFISSIVEYSFYNSPLLTTREDASLLYDELIYHMDTLFNLKKTDNINFNDLLVFDLSSFISDLIKTRYSLNEIDTFVSNQFTPFNPNIDKVCLVVDRDKRSVTDKQYELLVNKCFNNKYELYVSNPCFEFWLLLHFNEIFDLEREKLIDNPKIEIDNDTINFTEYQLKKILPNFEKNNICFSQVRKNIFTAIENEIKFTQDIMGLQSSLGSNVGLLIKELIVG